MQLWTAYGAAGERCMALSVVVAVGDETADQLISRLQNHISKMKVGPGVISEGENDMGPVISQQHKKKKLKVIYILVFEQGASLLVDGRELKVADHETGFFVRPTLFDNVSPEMTIYQEEVGPVLAIVRVSDYNTLLLN